jgi:hypothetical protein
MATSASLALLNKNKAKPVAAAAGPAKAKSNVTLSKAPAKAAAPAAAETKNAGNTAPKAVAAAKPAPKAATSLSKPKPVALKKPDPPVEEPVEEVAVEVEEVATEAVAEAEGEQVNVETMDAKQLEALFGEYGIDKPEGWAKRNLAGKRAWFLEQFSGEATTEEVAVAEEVAEPIPEIAAAKPAKGKAVATKAAAKSGELLEPSELDDIVNTIENMKEKEAIDVIGQLAEEAEFTYFRLGGVFARVQAQGWYAPFPSFREFVEQKYGINYRRAMYWVEIYNSLVNSKVPYGKVKHLGWTKLSIIASLLTNDNVDEWVKIAMGSTALQLADTAKKSKQTTVGQLTDQSASTVTTKTFKLHEDQKETVEAALEKAKEIGGFKDDTPAFEHICIEYLNGTIGAATKAKGKQKTLLEMITEASIEDVAAALGEGKAEFSFAIEEIAGEAAA